MAPPSAATLRKKIAVLRKSIKWTTESVLEAVTLPELDDDVFKEMVGEVIAKVSEVLELHEDLIKSDPGVDISGEIQTIESEVATAERSVRKAVLTRTPTPAAPTTAALSRGVTFREQVGLRPVDLSSTFTPPEFKSWLKKFKSYHSSSHMETLSLTEQHSYLTARLEPCLSNLIDASTISTTTMSECYGILRKRFLELYPIFQRRWSWFQVQLEPQQSFQDAYTSLLKVGDEAEVEKMTKDDWVIFRLLSMAQARPLLQYELLKLSNPTLQQLLDAASAFEVAHLVTVEQSQAMGRDTLGGGVDATSVGEAVAMEPVPMRPTSMRWLRPFGGTKYRTMMSRITHYASRTGHTSASSTSCPSELRKRPLFVIFYMLEIALSVLFPTLVLLSPFFHFLHCLLQFARIFWVRVHEPNGLVGPLAQIKAIFSRDLSGPPLIGWRDCVALGILPKDFPRINPGLLSLPDAAEPPTSITHVLGSAADFSTNGRTNRSDLNHCITKNVGGSQLCTTSWVDWLIST